MNLLTIKKVLIRLRVYNIARAIAFKLDTNEHKSQMFFSEFVKENDLVFDVGANIGQKTDIFTKLGANTVSIEPQRDCADFLQLKYKFNRKVTIVNKALDEKEGANEIYICEANALSSMSKRWMEATQNSGRNQNFSWKKKISIPTTTLDQLISLYGKPHFCKIDVEGFEYNVLKGLSQQIPYISLEIAPESVDSIRNCLSHLSSIGTIVTNHCCWNQNHFTFKTWIKPEKLIEIISEFDIKSITGDIYVHFPEKEF